MSYTFAELKTAVASYELGNDEALFTAQLPNFIRQAEERILKGVQLLIFRKNSAPTVTLDDPEVTLPADFLAPVYLALVSDGDFAVLEQKDTSFIKQYWPDPTATSVPRYYALRDQDTLLLAPTPSAAFVADLQYLYRPASLADGADGGSTWLSTNAPAAMLYGTLMEAAVFLKEPEGTLTLYNSRFSEALARLKNLGEGMQTTDFTRYGQVRSQRT
jgi:hypothetical protein